MRGTINASNVPQGIAWMHVLKSQRAHAQARQKNIKSDFQPSNAVDQPINTGKGLPAGPSGPRRLLEGHKTPPFGRTEHCFASARNRSIGLHALLGVDNLVPTAYLWLLLGCDWVQPSCD